MFSVYNQSRSVCALLFEFWTWSEKLVGMAGPDDALREAADRARAAEATAEAARRDAEQRRRDDSAYTEKRILEATRLVRRFLQIIAQHGNPGLQHQNDRKILGKKCGHFPNDPHPYPPSYPGKPWLTTAGEFAYGAAPARWRPMSTHLREMMFAPQKSGYSYLAPGSGDEWRNVVDMKYRGLADALGRVMAANDVTPP